MSENRTVATKRAIGVGAWGGNGGLHSKERQASTRIGRASKDNPPKRSRKKHKRVSGRKSFLGGSTESRFHTKFGPT